MSGAPLDAVIRRRRMTREFTDEHVEPERIGELIDTARRAPSAGYSQGVHFVVLSGVAVGRFWTITGAGEWFNERRPGVMRAPVMVLPIAVSEEYTARYAEVDKRNAGLDDAARWPVPFWLTDTAMAVQNLLLLLEDSGLGALYFGIFEHVDELLADLGVPSGAQLVGVVAIGHRHAADRPSGSPTSRPRRPLSDVVHRDHW